MTEHVISSRAGPVYRIELNRPDCGNLVTTEMVFALTDAVARLPADAKLLVLSGKGADFCKGRDPQTAPEAARGGRAPSALELRERMAGPIYRDHLLPAPRCRQGGEGVPEICAADGAARAGGFRRQPDCRRALVTVARDERSVIHDSTPLP